MSPRELEARAAEAAAAEQARRSAETDGARQRALRDMMGGTLEGKKVGRAEALLVSSSLWGMQLLHTATPCGQLMARLRCRADALQGGTTSPPVEVGAVVPS